MNRRGFTVLELLAVIAMIAVVAAFAAPFLSGGTGRASLSSFAGEAADALREAQGAVMSGKDNARYGVHFQSDRFVVFSGAAYAPADPANRVRQFNGEVTVTSVTLSPGGPCTVVGGSGNCDVHFADHRGVPTESGSVVLTDAAGNARTVTVGAQGMIDVQ